MSPSAAGHAPLTHIPVRGGRNTVGRAIGKLGASRGVAARCGGIPGSCRAGLHPRASVIRGEGLTRTAHCPCPGS